MSEQKEFTNLGQTVITRGVHERAQSDQEYHKFIVHCLEERYKKCDWGNLCDEDKQANNEAITDSENQERVLARYNHKKGDIYIITEWDRSATTILFPSEY